MQKIRPKITQQKIRVNYGRNQETGKTLDEKYNEKILAKQVALMQISETRRVLHDGGKQEKKQIYSLYASEIEKCLSDKQIRQNQAKAQEDLYHSRYVDHCKNINQIDDLKRQQHRNDLKQAMETNKNLIEQKKIHSKIHKLQSDLQDLQNNQKFIFQKNNFGYI